MGVDNSLTYVIAYLFTYVPPPSTTLLLAVTDPAMGGQGGRPPIDQNLGLAMASRLRHGGKFSLKSLTFGHFLCKNVQKAFSPLTPHQGLCPWTPLGAPPLDPRLGSHSARSPWSSPLWQILDPPLVVVTENVQDWVPTEPISSVLFTIALIL